MSNKDRNSPPSQSSPSQSSNGRSKRSGRVTYDSRGNPVWEWQTATGVFNKDVSTENLKKLEAPELSLLDTQAVAKQSGKEKSESGKQRAGAKLETQPERRGFNPYDSANRGGVQPVRDFDSRVHHPALAHKQKNTNKQQPRQSLQTKYANQTKAAKPKGLLDRLKSVFDKD